MAEGNDCPMDMFKSCIKQDRSMDEKRCYKVCWLFSTQCIHFSEETKRYHSPMEDYLRTQCLLCDDGYPRSSPVVLRDWRAHNDTSHTSPGPATWTRLALNLQRPSLSLSLLSAEIIGMCYHTWLQMSFLL